MNTLILSLTAFWFFYFGAAMGSFYNVLVHRLPHEKAVVWSRSECEYCHARLKWSDLIPLFSFLFLKRRCRYCGKKLPYQYLISELTVGALFLLAFLRYGRYLEYSLALSCMVLWSMLFVAGVMDYIYGIIIDQILIVFSGIGIVVNLIGKAAGMDIILGGAVGFGFYGVIYLIARLFYKKEGFGMGDVLLLTGIGTFLGPAYTLLTGFLAFYCCILFVLFQMKNRRIERKMEVPFAPSVCAAAFLVSVFGEQMVDFFRNWLGV